MFQMEMSAKEMYESFENGQVQACANLIMSMRYGCSTAAIFENIQEDNIVLSGFISDLWDEAEKEDANARGLIGYLSTEDGALIDMNKVYQLLVAYQYGKKYDLIELREELLPQEMKEYIKIVNESRKDN